MYYNVSIQSDNHDWIYVITFGKETPSSVKGAGEYADQHLSAEDKLGTRHYVLLKEGKLVQIQLHQFSGIMSYIDPAHPESISMPSIQAVMFGQPPVPTLLITFKSSPVDNETAFAICPNIFLIFDNEDLVRMYIYDAYKMIADLD